jgi:anti-sigma B factor antagonist
MPEPPIWYRHEVRECLNARQGKPVHARARPGENQPYGAGGLVDLKLDHYSKDGIEIVDVEGEIDVYTAPRLRELLIELVNSRFYQLVVNMEKVEFLDSTGLGVLVGGLKRVRAHDGSLDLVCTQERILKIFRITGLTKVFGIHDTVDEAIAARRSEK